LLDNGEQYNRIIVRKQVLTNEFTQTINFRSRKGFRKKHHGNGRGISLRLFVEIFSLINFLFIDTQIKL
ncbi:hypothetical protein, partial [Escherichia coli]|uniref:hypothetical protein n=1 Tax=Escherichia coli TaxID=562 RepID=UPI001BAE77AC